MSNKGQIEEYRIAVQTSLDKLLAQLATIEFDDVAEQAKQPITSAQLSERIAVLIETCDDGDPDAKQLIEELHQFELSREQQRRLKKASNLLDDYEFDGAIEQLKQLA
ncbi:hypothetical protein GCM10011369_26780 [Neiella marina]|uniref:Uncharacterized protein n=1 Tax=Neiella marina TaxID=508461 RepID=A0A8J2XQ63_9GAMM|nr:hypothetical protein [Neiella marina]GGA83429.1 hypothetical protein GCM10011369_26780 [Neiella marina]